MIQLQQRSTALRLLSLYPSATRKGIRTLHTTGNLESVVTSSLIRSKTDLHSRDLVLQVTATAGGQHEDARITDWPLSHVIKPEVVVKFCSGLSLREETHSLQILGQRWCGSRQNFPSEYVHRGIM